MFLETLDLRTTDVLIYSQNMFNFDESFKIVFKNEKLKRPRRITYFDVCSYIKDPSPKNLVIYRLLTNVNNLNAYTTKYGYFIKINGKNELIYFDPIFAIKDLRHLRFDLDPDKFRFKIQQSGLTSLTKKESEPNFAEVYSFDLKAIEAQSQNDKIFADAIFAFDENYVDKEIDDGPGKDLNKERIHHIDTTSNIQQELAVSPVKISEDRNAPGSQFSILRSPDNENVHDLREEIIRLLKHAMGIDSVNNQKAEQTADSVMKTLIEREQRELLFNKKNEASSNLFDLFKTTNKSEELTQRVKDSVILKFD
jgi:hypothetical protein